MSRQKSSSALVVGLVLIFGVVPLASGQRRQPAQDPQNTPRNVKPEPGKAFKDWINKDVPYIITEAERRAFNRLTTDEEREAFIGIFWDTRDPDPDTEENEYKDEYYERLAYSNEHFTSGKPGWMTDRGRFYIKYGKPDEVESHPTGGPYERPSYHGGGSTVTYPFEIWSYRYIDGVSSGIEIEFVDPTGTGEYRVARSPEEKDALSNVMGAGLNLAEMTGIANKADRVLGQGQYANGNAYSREQDSPFSRLIRDTELMSRPPSVRVNESGGVISTSNSIVDENPLDFAIRMDYFRLSDQRVITAFTIQIENKDLVFLDNGGIQKATLNIFGRITNVANRKVGNFEDSVTTEATPEELASIKERKSAYQKVMALVPGKYKIDVTVRDVATGATGTRPLAFEVPKFDASRLSASTLLLAVRLEAVGDRNLSEMFLIGQNKVIPNLSGIYHRGNDVGIYLQVYNAGIDQTTLRPSVDVEYVLLKDGKEVGKQTEDWSGMSDSGQRLTLARLLPTAGLSPGDYKIEIRIRDRVTGQVLAPSADFTLVK